MSKRFLSLVLALVMVLGTLGTVVLAAPSDVAGTEYEEAVGRLELLGILEGFPDGTFRPDAQITRAQFAAVVVRAKGLEAVAQAAEGLPTGFSDVAADSWASGYVGTAAKLGIVNGKGNGKFDPAAPVKYEEAITMIIRALGYEPAAEARGAYPYGYLIVANEVGLLDAVKGVQGLPASRGTVAQLADNALEIPMMIQVGYGAQTKWVVSGSKEHDGEARYFLDDMGFEVAVGRVTSVNESRSRITVDGKTLTVDEDFDFNFVEGLRIKAWYSGSKVVVFATLEEALYGAASDDSGKIRIDGKSYKVADKAELLLDNEDDFEEFEADYAKVLLNSDDEVVWAKGYTLGYALVVAEVDGNVAYDFDNYDVDLKDYTILKDGKTISVEDMEEMDVLLYNRAEKFAIVYNDSKVGEIDRVYDSSFRFDGKVYTIEGKYLDGKAFGELSSSELDKMVDEEEDVEVFFNTQGKVVLVVGERGIAPSSSFYGLVTHAKVYQGRRGDMLALDVRNKEGKLVSYDIAKNSDDEYLSLPEDGIETLKDEVILVTVNKDDNPTKLATVLSKDIDAVIKLSDSYVDGKRLQDSTIIFYGTKAVELGEAKGFTQVKEDSTIYYSTTDRIVAIVGETNADSDVDTKTDLVTRVRRLSNDRYEFTFENGDRYVTESKDDDDTNYENKIVELKVGKTSGLITAAEVKSGTPVTVDSRSTGSRTIKGKNGKTYELISGAKLYDITNPNRPKAMSLIDLKEDDEIQVYLDGGSSRFVRFVVKVDVDANDDELPEGAVEFKGILTLDGNKYVQLGDKSYPYVGDSVAFENGDMVVPTFTEIRGETVVTSLELVETP